MLYRITRPPTYRTAFRYATVPATKTKSSRGTFPDMLLVPLFLKLFACAAVRRAVPVLLLDTQVSHSSCSSSRNGNKQKDEVRLCCRYAVSFLDPPPGGALLLRSTCFGECEPFLPHIYLRTNAQQRQHDWSIQCIYIYILISSRHSLFCQYIKCVVNTM